MKYVKLGNSNLNVSRICMGCMGFGDPQKRNAYMDIAGKGIS